MPQRFGTTLRADSAKPSNHVETRAHIGEKLHSPRLIMSSDVDRNVVIAIIAGFTVRGELAITADLHNLTSPRRNCSTAAIVNTDDSHKMARCHNVRHEHLPQFIVTCFEEWRRNPHPDLKDALDCFKELTECLLDEGCRFRIERTVGKNDNICC